MNRKKYYRLLEEYNTLVEQKKYNKLYFDEKRFELVKKKLCNYIQSICHLIEYTYLDCVINRKYAQAAAYENDAIRLAILFNNITKENLILENDYKNTYCNELFFGLLTRTKLICGVVTCVVLFVIVFCI